MKIAASALSDRGFKREGNEDRPISLDDTGPLV